MRFQMTAKSVLMRLKACALGRVLPLDLPCYNTDKTYFYSYLNTVSLTVPNLGPISPIISEDLKVPNFFLTKDL